MAETYNILPCPFCGHDVEITPKGKNGIIIKCTNCIIVNYEQRSLRYSLEWLESKMIENFNTRSVNGSSKSDILDRLERLIDNAVENGTSYDRNVIESIYSLFNDKTRLNEK